MFSRSETAPFRLSIYLPDLIVCSEPVLAKRRVVHPFSTGLRKTHGKTRAAVTCSQAQTVSMAHVPGTGPALARDYIRTFFQFQQVRKERTPFWKRSLQYNDIFTKTASGQT